jgi:uncharacterized membrane protein YfcA
MSARIKWPDAIITFVLFGVLYILARNYIVPNDFLNISSIISTSAFIALITSISMIFYVYRNKSARYQDIAVVAFLVPVVFLIGTFLLSSLSYFAEVVVFAIVVIIFSLLWRYVFGKK